MLKLFYHEGKIYLCYLIGIGLSQSYILIGVIMSLIVTYWLRILGTWTIVCYYGISEHKLCYVVMCYCNRWIHEYFVSYLYNDNISKMPVMLSLNC